MKHARLDDTGLPLSIRTAADADQTTQRPQQILDQCVLSPCGPCPASSQTQSVAVVKRRASFDIA